MNNYHKMKNLDYNIINSKKPKNNKNPQTKKQIKMYNIYFESVTFAQSSKYLMIAKSKQ